jgi:hypothetical protein
MKALNLETAFITFQKTITTRIRQLRFLMFTIGFIKIRLILNIYVLVPHHRLELVKIYRFSTLPWERLKVLSLFGLRRSV